MFFIIAFGSIFILNLMACIYAAATLSGVHFRTLGALFGATLSASVICYFTVPVLHFLGVPWLFLWIGVCQFLCLFLTFRYLNRNLLGVRFDTSTATVLTAALLTGLNWMISVICNLSCWVHW